MQSCDPENGCKMHSCFCSFGINAKKTMLSWTVCRVLSSSIIIAWHCWYHLWKAVQATGLIIETSYLLNLCMCVPSMHIKSIWPVFLKCQPFFFFPTIAYAAYMVDHSLRQTSLSFILLRDATQPVGEWNTQAAHTHTHTHTHTHQRHPSLNDSHFSFFL